MPVSLFARSLRLTARAVLLCGSVLVAACAEKPPPPVPTDGGVSFSSRFLLMLEAEPLTVVQGNQVQTTVMPAGSPA